MSLPEQDQPHKLEQEITTDFPWIQAVAPENASEGLKQGVEAFNLLLGSMCQYGQWQLWLTPSRATS